MSLQKLADLADLDLQKALPSLIEAQNALETINKRDISEIKTYAKPSVLIVKVLEAVMVLKGIYQTLNVLLEFIKGLILLGMNQNANLAIPIF